MSESQRKRLETIAKKATTDALDEDEEQEQDEPRSPVTGEDIHLNDTWGVPPSRYQRLKERSRRTQCAASDPQTHTAHSIQKDRISYLQGLQEELQPKG
jgi:hypothetical protein